MSYPGAGARQQAILAIYRDAFEVEPLKATVFERLLLDEIAERLDELASEGHRWADMAGYLLHDPDELHCLLISADRDYVMGSHASEAELAARDDEGRGFVCPKAYQLLAKGVAKCR